MLNAAIFGMGRWGQNLVNSVQGKSDKIKFKTGIVRTVERYESFAKENGLELSNDYAAVLADSSIEAVVLATPNSLHADHIKMAAAAGKHIFVEKPFTLTRASAEAAAKACTDAKITLAVGFNRRFRPALIDMRQAIVEGRIGNILHIEGQHAGPTGYNIPPDVWRAERSHNPVGGMAARGIHTLDAMIHLGGDIRSVYALSDRREIPIDVDDTSSMLFQFKNGITGYLGVIFATADFWRIHVFGSKGWIEMRSEHALAFSDLDGNVEEKKYDPTDTVKDELEAFANAASGGKAYPVSLAEAIHGSAVFEAVDKSAATGDKVMIP
ncbi:MAG: Gfo/Idh/MocA family oxidoreductase [Rhodospirillales bacterium]|nr:Gfo/Idh/MocA family oxidoreductase [Rhodospirillales bacterium]